MEYKVLDPQGLRIGGKLHERGAVVDLPRSGQTNAWLHFGQIKLASEKQKLGGPISTEHAEAMVTVATAKMEQARADLQKKLDGVLDANAQLNRTNKDLTARVKELEKGATKPPEKAPEPPTDSADKKGGAAS